MTPRRALVVQSIRPLKVPMGHTSGALAPRNSAGCVRRRLDGIFLFTFDPEWSDPTPVGCLPIQKGKMQSMHTGRNDRMHAL